MELITICLRGITVLDIRGECVGSMRTLGEMLLVSFWSLRGRVQSSPTWSKVTLGKRRGRSRGHVAPVSLTQAGSRETDS